MADTLKIFVAPANCPVAVKVTEVLGSIDMRIKTDTFEGEGLPSHLVGISSSLVALFEADGKYPGLHRILRPNDVEPGHIRNRDITIPDWARGLAVGQWVAWRSWAHEDPDVFKQSVRTLYSAITRLWIPASRKKLVGTSSPPKVSGISRRDLAHPSIRGGL